jgi:hypothetical protein
MSRVRVALLSMLAAFAVSAVASASASATHAYLIEQTEITSSEVIEDDSYASQLEGKVAGLPIYIECSEDLSSGVIKPKGESTFEIKFSNCFIVENSKGKMVFETACEVKEPIVAAGKDQLIEHSVDEFKGEGTEEKFVENLEIKGTKCVLNGKYVVKGSQLCATIHAEFEKVIHNLDCTPSGSKLKFAGEAAQFFGEEQVKLASQKVWAAT